MSNGLPNKKSTSKMIALFFGAFLILFFLCALCLPLFFSTASGKKMLLKMISNRTGLQIEINELSLSWFGSQDAKGIHVQKKQEQLDFTAQEIQTDAFLWKILFAKHLGQMQITAPNLQIAKPFLPAHPSSERIQLRKRSFQAAAFSIPPDLAVGMSNIELPIKGKVLIKEGRVEFNCPGLEPIAFDQITVSMDITSKEELALALNCTTSQQGQIAIKGSASHLTAPLPDLCLQTTINQLPVRGIDQLVSLIYPKASGFIYSLLGPTINVGCHLSASSGNFDLRLNAISPQINAYIATQSLNGLLSLKSPAELNFTLTPLFLQKMAKLYPSLCSLALTSPVLFQTTIEQFSCPVPSNLHDLITSSFQAKLNASSQIPLLLNGKPLSLNSLSITANGASFEQQFSANLLANLETERQAGSIVIESTMNRLPFDNRNGLFSLNAKKFPIGLMDAFVTTSCSSLSELLGSLADVNARIDFKPGDQKLHLSWQSDFLNVPAIDLSLSQSLTLISPSPFTFTLNPKVINTLFPAGQLQLAKEVAFQATLQNLSVPLQNIRSARLSASLNANQIAFSGLPLNFKKMQALFSVNTFDQIDLQIEGEAIKATLFGSYNPTSTLFTLTKPFSLQYTLDQPTFQTLLSTSTELVKPSIFQLSIDPFAFSLSEFDLSTLKIKGQLSSDETILRTQSQQIALQQSRFPFQLDPAAKTASVQLASQVQNPSGDSGTMQGQFNLSQFLTDKGFDVSTAVIQAGLDLQNLSSTLLDTFSGKRLSAIIGHTFNSQLKWQSTPDKQNLNVKCSSPNLNIDTGFTWDHTLQLQGGNHQMTWILTPEGYKALDQILAGPTTSFIPFEIHEASLFTITFSKFSLPVVPKPKVNSLADRFPKIDVDLAKLELNATGRNSKLTFFDKSSRETIQLTNMNFSLNKTDQTPFAATMDSSILTQGSKVSARSGSISLNAQLQQTLNTQGKFDFSKLTGSLQLKAQQLPSRALDIIARAKGRTDFPFTTLFGNMINAALSVQLDQFSGPVSFNVNTPLTRADISGTIKNGALMLKDALHVQMKITPEISRLVLKEVNPLNLSYIYSQDPITLVIPATGFYFPLYPFDLSKITIPKAKIELGKIACRNEGNVNIALGLLRNKQFEKNSDLMLWFAPIDLSVKQGMTDIERTEILLANTFEVCLWGTVDLVKDYIDMTLGLTAQTLSKAFGIKNLPKNYVLRIPLRGKSNNVQIDTGAATAKITMLFAWQQAGAAGAFSRGPAGAIIGGLVNKMATLPDSNAKVPPPKQPFPWEVSKSKTSAVKKKPFRADEKPLKQILKLIR